MSINLSGPFRGSEAVALGLLTKNVLRGARFRALFPDVYVPAELDADLGLRSRAAHLFVAPRGVLAGYSAAEVWGASCGDRDSPAEVALPGSEHRGSPGLRILRYRPKPDELTTEAGMRVTTPLRTAYDLARREVVVRAVVAVDALARAGDFAPDALLDIARNHRGDRGVRRLPGLVALTDPRSESPMETRLRLSIVLAGLPAPVSQHPVDLGGWVPHRLDLAYPEVRLGIEYDGGHHRTPERALRDLERQARLTRAGWEILRFAARVLCHHPWEVAVRVHRALLSRGVATPNVSPESIARL